VSWLSAFGEAYLARYLAEFDFRYSNCIAFMIDDIVRTNKAVRVLPVSA
jgi:hypothetical protein